MARRDTLVAAPRGQNVASLWGTGASQSPHLVLGVHLGLGLEEQLHQREMPAATRCRERGAPLLPVRPGCGSPGRVQLELTQRATYSF